MKIIKWIPIIIGLILLNLLILECLLRVGGLFQTISESNLNEELISAEHIIDYSSNMEDRLIMLDLEHTFDLDRYGKENRISYLEVERDNPYPPIAHLFDSAYVIYTKDGKLKQITILSGECDATPSILVDKVRGNETGFGDHFITYIFYKSEMRRSHVEYDRIDWYSWRGGSYNGFEELWIVPLTLLEVIFLMIWAGIRRQYKLFLRKRSP